MHYKSGVISADTGAFSKRMTVAAFVILIYADLFSGVIRYSFSVAGLTPLIYFPFFFAFVAWFSASLIEGFSRGNWRYVWIIFTILLLSILSLYLGRSYFELGLGFWAWGPFLIGILVAASVRAKTIEKHLVIAMFIAIAGVFADYFVEFPWASQNYEIFGVSVSAARSWTTYGTQRLSGFGRVSEVVAAQILIGTYIFLSRKNINIAYKVPIWLLAMLATYLTTSKAALLGVIVSPIIIFPALIIQSLDQIYRKYVGLAYIRSVLTVLILVVIFPPLISDYLVGRLSAGEGGGFLNGRSFFDRAYQMWPASLDLINRDGNSFEHIVGRGIGGIGAALFRSEGIRLSGDNLFVALYVSFGLMSFAFFAMIVKGFNRLISTDENFAWICFYLASALLITATTSITIEVAPMCLMLGIVIGKAISADRRTIVKEAIVR